MSGQFVLKASGDQFLFNLEAGNREVILTSERYTAKASALKGIESVRENAGVEERFQKRLSSSEEPYFVLRAGNNEVLGTSEMYSSPSARDRGIAAVKVAAPVAAVDDRTGSGKRGW